MATDLWYCSLKSGVWGPASKQEVEKILKDGHLNKKTWVRKKEDENWIALEDADLFPLEEIPDISGVDTNKKTADTAPPEKMAEEEIPDTTDSKENTQVKTPTEDEDLIPVHPQEKEGSEDDSPSEKKAIAAEVTQKSKEALIAFGEKGQQALQAIDLDQKKEQAKATFNLYRLFWTRVLKSDFSVIKSTKEEADKLKSGPENVSSPLAQDYASWRRSMLMICILLLAIGTLFNITDFFSTLGHTDTHFVQKIQSVFLFLFQLGSVLLCATAARKWVDLRKSRSLARFAWLLQFLGPFLIFLVPLSLFVDDGMVLAQLGLGAVLILAPKIFGLFPGLIRCSLTVKTLLPETSTPGWLGIIIAPTYSLFLAMATIIAIQASEIILGIGFALLAVGMTIVILRARLLLKATDQQEASDIVKGIKQRQMIFQLSGVACIAVSIFLAIDDIDFGLVNNLFLFVFSFTANVTLLTVVMSDFMLGMIRQGQLQATAFAGTPLEKSLTERLDDLAACGLTDLEAGEAEFAASFREKGGFLAKAASARGSKLVERARQMSNKPEEKTGNPEDSGDADSAPEDEERS